MRAKIVVSAVAALVLMTPAFSQSPAGPQGAPQKMDPKACSDRERLPSDDTHETTGAAPRDTLSDKLARTDGVICPPSDIDPDVQRPAPGGGAMPVIPPPGSPGGDPSVKPK